AALRGGAARERHLHGVRRTVARVGHADLVAALLRLHRGTQCRRRGDVVAVDGGDHVAGLEAGLRGRAAVGDLGHVDALAVVCGLHADAEEPGVGRGAAATVAVAVAVPGELPAAGERVAVGERPAVAGELPAAGEPL